MIYDEFTVGQKYAVKKIITTEMVDAFAAITGDKNPVHVDGEFAKTTRFGRRIAHGMLSVGIISAILGNDFPGPGSIYMKQDVKFFKPIYLEEEVEIEIELLEKIEEKKSLLVRSTVKKSSGEIAVDGEALLLFTQE
jgi:3-hydroxybutyryl-CoA dehydratase